MVYTKIFGILNNSYHNKVFLYYSYEDKCGLQTIQ